MPLTVLSDVPEFVVLMSNTRRVAFADAQILNSTPWAIKKRATLFGIITSMFHGGFLHFLHQWKQEKILYWGITKFATLPQLCLYTTWKNLTHILKPTVSVF